MAGLALGRSVVWGGQARDAYGISLADGRCATCGRRRCSASSCAARCSSFPPTVLLWSLPLTLGYLLAVPFCVLTAAPAWAGSLLQRLGLAAIPEDFEPLPEVAAIQARRR